MKTFIYKINNTEYMVNVTTRYHNKNIVFRFKDYQFYISCPYHTSLSHIKTSLDDIGPRLIKRDALRNPILSRGEDYIFILGEKINISFPGEIVLEDKKYCYLNKDELDTILFKWFYGYIVTLHKEVEQIMNISPYKVKLKKMSSRYGSNSYMTRTINYSFVLIHYDKNIIKTVIYHELCHDKVRNHRKEFYDLLIKYCPDYFNLDRHLKKGKFHL